MGDEWVVLVSHDAFETNTVSVLILFCQFLVVDVHYQECRAGAHVLLALLVFF